MKKCLFVMLLSLSGTALNAVKLSDIIFGVTPKDKAEKIIDEWGIMGGYTNKHEDERFLYKLAYNAEVKYCLSNINNKNCLGLMSPTNKEKADFDSYIVQFEQAHGFKIDDLYINDILKQLNAVDNINAYLHGIPKLYVDKGQKHDSKFYQDLLTGIIDKFSFDLSDANQNALISDNAATKHNILKTLLNKIAQAGGDLSAIKNKLKTKNLNIFEQYLTQQEQLAQQKQAANLHLFAQGLADIK